MLQLLYVRQNSNDYPISTVIDRTCKVTGQGSSSIARRTAFFAKMASNLCCLRTPEMKQCRAELGRLRKERWQAGERKAVLEEKRHQDFADIKYLGELRQWQKCHDIFVANCDRRKKLLRQIRCQREQLAKVKEEARRWRCYQRMKFIQQKARERDNWIKECTQSEEQRRIRKNQIRLYLEDKWVREQTTTEGFAYPDLADVLGMLAPVQIGPNRTYEYFMVEPRPDTAALVLEKRAEMAPLLGLHP